MLLQKIPLTFLLLTSALSYFQLRASDDSLQAINLKQDLERELQKELEAIEALSNQTVTIDTKVDGINKLMKLKLDLKEMGKLNLLEDELARLAELIQNAQSKEEIDKAVASFQTKVENVKKKTSKRKKDVKLGELQAELKDLKQQQDNPQLANLAEDELRRIAQLNQDIEALMAMLQNAKTDEEKKDILAQLEAKEKEIDKSVASFQTKVEKIKKEPTKPNLGELQAELENLQQLQDNAQLLNLTDDELRKIAQLNREIEALIAMLQNAKTKKEKKLILAKIELKIENLRNEIENVENKSKFTFTNKFKKFTSKLLKLEAIPKKKVVFKYAVDNIDDDIFLTTSLDQLRFVYSLSDSIKMMAGNLYFNSLQYYFSDELPFIQLLMKGIIALLMLSMVTTLWIIFKT